MLYDLDIPPAEIGPVTSWLGDSGPLRSRMSEYVVLALRQRHQPQCYADIAHCAREGDLDAELGRRLLDLLVKEEEYETALLVLHASGLRKQHSGLIAEAEKALDPGTTARHSLRWVDLVFNKFWLDWSPQFRSTLIEYAENNAFGMTSDTWSPEALEELAIKLRNELNRPERVVPKAACALAGIEEEAAQAVVAHISEVIHRGDLEFGLDLAADWAMGVGDLDLNSQSKAMMCQAAAAKARGLAKADKAGQAFRICKAWGVDPREALSEILTLSSGDASTKALVAGFDQGVFRLFEVEAWFLERLKQGDIGKALGLRRSASLRGELHGSAILGALETLPILSVQGGWPSHLGVRSTGGLCSRA